MYAIVVLLGNKCEHTHTNAFERNQCLDNLDTI